MGGRDRSGFARLLLVLVAALLPAVGACGFSRASGTPGPSPSSLVSIGPPSASSIASATAGPIASAAGWRRSLDQPSLADAALTSVAWTGDRFLATASMGDHGLADSVDGLTWNRQPRFDTDGHTAGPTLLGVGRGGVVAIGGGDRIPIWLSTDGLAWTAAPAQDALEPRDAAFLSLEGIAATDDGWIAVGSESYMCEPMCPLRAVVITSADGLHWTRLPEQPQLQNAAMHAVTRTPTGYLAVGSVLVDPGDAWAGLRAAAWTSPDGTAWTPLEPASMGIPAGWVPTDGGLEVTLRGIGFAGRAIAVGEARPMRSPDGVYVRPVAIAWVLEPPWDVTRIGPFTEGAFITVASLSNSVMAVTGPADDCPSGVRVSNDGVAWACGATGEAFADSVVRGAGTSATLDVLVGYRLAEPTMGASWVRPSAAR